MTERDRGLMGHPRELAPADHPDDGQAGARIHPVRLVEPRRAGHHAHNVPDRTGIRELVRITSRNGAACFPDGERTRAEHRHSEAADLAALRTASADPREAGSAHLVACRPWLDAEVTEVDPQLIVVLGAAAARSILGPGIKVTKQRGEILTREPAYQALVEDLRVAAVAVQA